MLFSLIISKLNRIFPLYRDSRAYRYVYLYTFLQL